MTEDNRAEQSSSELLKAFGDCLRSGRAVLTAAHHEVRHLVKGASQQISGPGTDSPALFFEIALCTTKLMSSRFNCEVGVAPVHAVLHAQARLGGMGFRFDWKGGGGPEMPERSTSASGA